ncbi:MAG: indole-3-glycerol-phosphate synthase, partial [Candidatus Binatia bacterium]
FDPALHARQYQQAGATCVSVLTDEPFFQGSLAYLSAVREATSLPLLQKDFMVDPWQVAEARAYGADAILLIVSAIGASRLVEIDLAAREEGLDVLVEVHSESEMAVALELGATLVGINNRDLETFETSTDITRRLATMVPEGVVLVSESGLSDPSELRELEELGVAGFLIGESLMGSEHPGDALAEFMAG